MDIYLQDQNKHFIPSMLKAIHRQKLFIRQTQGNGSIFKLSAVDDSSGHTISACLKEFHNTHQDKLEKEDPPPQVINLTEILTVKNPKPFCR